MSPTSYQAAPPRVIDSTRLAALLQLPQFQVPDKCPIFRELWHGAVQIAQSVRPGRERKYLESLRRVHNFQLLAEVPFQQKVRVPGRTVLRGENEAHFPAANLDTKRVHDLNRNRNVSDCVLRFRRLDLAAPHSLTDANEFPKRVNVTDAQPAKFSRAHSSLNSQPVAWHQLTPTSSFVVRSSQVPQRA